MGEPIKKLGQIVSDIQDTLGQFNNNILKSGDVDINIEKNINEENNINDIKIDENHLFFKKEKSETLNIKNDINEITEMGESIDKISSKITEGIFEKTDQDFSVISMRENGINNNQIDINQYDNDNYENLSHQSSTDDEKYKFYENHNTNIEDSIKSDIINNNDNTPKALNYNLNNDISDNKVITFNHY